MIIKLNLNRKNKGYSILSVILVIVAVIVTISIWAISGQNNTSNIDSESLIVESLLNDSNAIKAEYDKLLAAGNMGSKIVFLPNTASTPAAPNILDPTTGIQYPKVNPKILKAGITNPRGIWAFSKRFGFSYFDKTNSPDNTIFIVGIKDSICQKINNRLYGPETNAMKIYIDSSQIVTGATSTNPNSSATTMSAAVVQYGVVGCMISALNPDDSTFFRILQIN